GAVVPIVQVAELARVWYGKHADHDWEKWSIAQARQIFEQVRGWWAPCIWCALGVAALVGEDVVIHSRIGGEAEKPRPSCLRRSLARRRHRFPFCGAVV